MAFQFKQSESVSEGLQRIAREQIDGAVRTIDSDQMSGAEKVHDVRKRCKNLRGALRLTRRGLGDSYALENAWFRDTARPLGELRDAKVTQDTFDKLMDHYAKKVDRTTFESVRQALRDHSNGVQSEKRFCDQLQAARARFTKARERVARWSLEAEGFDGIAGGLSATYRLARKFMKQARKEPSPTTFHEARKHAKNHLHHCRLLNGLWAPLMESRQREAKRLSELLGDDHDLAVLASMVGGDPQACHQGQAAQELLALAAKRSEKLEQEATSLGRRLFAEKPSDFRQRMSVYWRVWRE